MGISASRACAQRETPALGWGPWFPCPPQAQELLHPQGGGPGGGLETGSTVVPHVHGQQIYVLI